MKYETTKDPNIIKQIETVESEIYLDKLEKQVADLETQISNTPTLIEKGKYPKEVLALIDEHNMMSEIYLDKLEKQVADIDKTELEAKLKKKKDLLTELKGL